MKKEKQLQYNVEEVLDMYLNGMYDFGEEEYPEMTIEECREYVIAEIYNMKSNGNGHTMYVNGICDDLKFLGNDYIYSVIDDYAKRLGILVKNQIDSVEITQEMLDKICTDSDIEDLAIALNVSYGDLDYFISNKYAEETSCHNCKYVGMYSMFPCNDCSRRHTVDRYELKER